MPVNAGPRLDRLPLSAWHRKVVALVAAGIFIDTFELYSGGGILAALTQAGWSSVALNAWFLAATFAGLTLGAWLTGVLGDALGRRFCYRANLLVFGMASLAAAVAPDMTALIALRFVMGLGLGAEVVAGYAALGEFLPASKRGRLVASVVLIANTSFFVSLLVSYWVLPTLGWRYMFLLPGLAAVAVWFARRAMPESPRWLEAQGRAEDAERQMQMIEREVAGGCALPAWRPAPLIDTAPVPFRALFAMGARRGTLLGMLINVVVGFSLYGFLQWLPTVFVGRGMSIGGSLLTTMVFAAGYTSGSFVSMLLCDRIGRKPCIVWFSVAAAAVGVGLTYTQGTPFLVGGYVLALCLGTANVAGFTVYVPELFETRLRMRGAGLCGAAGRLATVAMQFGIVALLAAGGLTAIVLALAALLLVQAAVVGLAGVETRQKPLDSSGVLAGTEPDAFGEPPYGAAILNGRKS